MQGKGGYYGRGAYFAENAAYSNGSFAFSRDGQRQLLLARVLCGKARDFGQQLHRMLCKPPPGYNSVTGGPHKARACSPSRIWVVYDRAQVYPAYIVSYITPAS